MTTAVVVVNLGPLLVDVYEVDDEAKVVSGSTVVRLGSGDTTRKTLWDTHHVLVKEVQPVTPNG